MNAASSAQISRLLADWGRGNPEAREALIPLVQSELCRQARCCLPRGRPAYTLQNCTLVNEVYLRFVRRQSPPWRNRAHRFGAATQEMRHNPVDHAWNRQAAERGARGPRLTLDEDVALAGKPEIDLLVLDEPLNKLAAMDREQSEEVELRFLAGPALEKAALVMGISPATVKCEWTTARAWLRHELGKEEEK